MAVEGDYEMGYVSDPKNPELVYAGGKLPLPADVEADIRKWVENMNASLGDSEFAQYQYRVEVSRNNVYIRRT